MRGTPFLFEGEELGLLDAVVPPDRVVDPGGRDGCRAPIPWTSQPPHGWDGAPTWLPFPPEQTARSVESSRADESSIMHLYRRLIAARHDSRALRGGSLTLLDAPDGVVAYERVDGDDRRTVVVNFTDEPHAVDVKGDVVVSSVDRDRFDGTLAPDEAVILR